VVRESFNDPINAVHREWERLQRHKVLGGITDSTHLDAAAKITSAALILHKTPGTWDAAEHLDEGRSEISRYWRFAIVPSREAIFNRERWDWMMSAVSADLRRLPFVEPYKDDWLVDVFVWEGPPKRRSGKRNPP
jgi:hypothetical protein